MTPADLLKLSAQWCAPMPVEELFALPEMTRVAIGAQVAALIAEAVHEEREACAKLADEEFAGSKRNMAERETGFRIATAIRARGAQ